jgi:hypothetical protein
MKRITLLLAVAALALAGCAARSNNPNTPSAGDSPYTVALKAANSIASGIGNGMTLVDQTRQNGLISAAEESKVLGYLKFANDADKAFADCIAAVHTSGAVGGFSTCAQTFNATLNNPAEMALIHVGNSKAQSDINAIVQGVITGVTTVVTALKGQ